MHSGSSDIWFLPSEAKTPPQSPEAERPAWQRFLNNRKAVASAAAILTIALFSGIAFVFGLRHDFHRMLPSPTHNELMAAAITEEVYAIRKGYVAHATVLNVLRRNGLTENAEELSNTMPPYPGNLRNPELLDAAIQKSLALGRLNSDIRFGNRTAIPAPMDDLGMADYFRWAFRLFGYRIASFYHLYFVLYGLSVAFFLLAYFRHPLPLGLLAAVSVTQALAFAFVANDHIPGFAARFGYGYDSPEQQMATVHCSRFLSVLGIIPMLHLILALHPTAGLKRRALLSRVVPSALAQACLLAFVMSLRCSGSWQLTFLAATAAGLLLLTLRERWRPGPGTATADASGPLALARRFWPAIIAAALLLLAQAYRSAHTNPFYRVADEVMPGHNVWHNLYIGLSYHPDYTRVFSPAFCKAEADDKAVIAASDYIVRHYKLNPNKYMLSPYAGHYRERTHERILKYAYKEFFAQRPFYVVTSLLWHKPVFLLTLYAESLKRSVLTLGLPLLLLGVGALAGVFALIRRIHPENFRRSALTLGALLLAGSALSCVPIVLTTPLYHAIGDQFWMITLSLLWILTAGLTLALPRRPPKPQADRP